MYYLYISTGHCPSITLIVWYYYFTHYFVYILQTNFTCKFSFKLNYIIYLFNFSYNNLLFEAQNVPINAKSTSNSVANSILTNASVLCLLTYPDSHASFSKLGLHTLRCVYLSQQPSHFQTNERTVSNCQCHLLAEEQNCKSWQVL